MYYRPKTLNIVWFSYKPSYQQQVSSVLTHFNFRSQLEIGGLFSILLLRLVSEFRRNRCKQILSAENAKGNFLRLAPLVPKTVSYRSSLSWSLIMTDVHGAEFTYIIVSYGAGERIFITRGGGTKRHDVETKDKSKVQLFFFLLK